MADTDILGLPAHPVGYIDETTVIPVQRVGESNVEGAKISDIFGGWKDMLGPIIAATGGPSAPNLVSFGSTGGLSQYKFAINNEVQFLFHVGHDMKQGATLYPHVHWVGSGVDVNTVKWELTYSLANREGEPAFPADTIINLEQAGKALAWAHQLIEDVVGIDTPAPDALLLFKLKRISNGGTDNGDNIFGLNLDLHYPTQMFATKNRTPNFYV